MVQRAPPIAWLLLELEIWRDTEDSSESVSVAWNKDLANANIDRKFTLVFAHKGF